MIRKKNRFVMLLFFVFSPVAGCMQMVVLKKKSDVRISESLLVKNLRCENNILKIKLEFSERSRYVVRGLRPAASTFLYSLYGAKNKKDFDNALMAKGEFFIQMYRGELIDGCSALGIIATSNVSFEEKKEFIRTLREDHCFKPTDKDKNFAFFIKLKEFMPSIIQKIYMVRYANFALKMPQDVKNCIAKKLFWLKFADMDSLL
ncbi:MAG TPA: hypothetical protein VHX42_02800 [Candidatus Babeliales bacterium]|jgi:hypothetical protein|nr:hypothetical protein [Candidatus Babeliales bacterium]